MRTSQLPDHYVITPAYIKDKETFVGELKAVLGNGYKLIQFRLFDLPDAHYIRLLQQTAEYCKQANAQLMLNADAAFARQFGITGLHLNGPQLAVSQARPADFKWVAASCHTAQELQHAQAIGVDFAVLSPVLPTATHPNAKPLGWQVFAANVASVDIPVYALGGMHTGLLHQAQRFGAHGIAGIRGLWPKASLA